MKIRFRRKMAAFLAAVMVTTSVPLHAIAEDITEPVTEPAEVTFEAPMETVADVPVEQMVDQTIAVTEQESEAEEADAAVPEENAGIGSTTVMEQVESSLTQASRAGGITLEMVSEKALIRTLVDFAVSAPGADTYTVEWYDAERNFISTSEKTLTDGAGTFQSWVDEPCTEIIVVSVEIDGVTYSDEMTVVYTSLGKTPGIPQITCEEMPVAHQPYEVTWTAVDGADYYYLYWERPGGLYLWRSYLEGTSYTIPGDQIAAEGEYCLQVAAMKAGYDIGEMAEKKFTVTESAVDDRVSITASKTQMMVGDVVQIVVSAPGAEAVRLYNVTADNSWYDEKRGERHEAGYGLTQDRTFYAMALYDGVWVASESITVTVLSNGKLDAPKVTVPSEVPAGKDVTVSWTEVANAERYWVQLWHDNNGTRGEFIKGFDPEGETFATLEHVLEPGSYRIVVLAIAEGYENGQSVDTGFTVTGALAAPPILTLDAEKYVYGSKITYTITAEGAEAIRLRYYGIGDDGDSWNQSFAFDADGTTTVYEADFYTAGSFSAVASVKVNGLWSAWSEPVPFEVRYLGELAAPVIEMKGSYAAGEEITVSWNSVENAEGYSVDLYDGTGEYLRSFYPGTGTTVTISEVLEAGDYQVRVYARTEGYKQSQSTASFRVSGELAAPPVLRLDAETYAAGSKITYTIAAENAELIRLSISGITDEGYPYSDSYEFLPDGLTTTEEKYFYTAGSFTAVASVKVNGAWSAWSEPVPFEVRYLGELDAPVLSMRDSYIAGAEIEVSWSAVENAESYGVSLYDSKGNHVKNWWVDVPETSVVVDMALDAGNYVVSVYARKQGWESSEEARKEFAVTGQLAEGPSFTVESYTVVTGKNATFTVFMEGATKFRLLCDERVTEHAAENGAATITRTLYGSHKQVTAQISACVNGIWTDYGPSQTIYIVDKPLLGAVKVTLPEIVRAGEDIEIIWEPVEHAENYSVMVETTDEETVWYDYIYAETEECRTVIPAGELKQGSYVLHVVAMAQEYSATGWNTQLDVQAPLPENAFRYYINSDGAEAQLNEYLGDPVPEELEIPAAIRGATVVSIFGPLFENGCNGLRITIPASVTYIASDAFDGCTDLTICGYSGSQAEEYAILNGHAFEALDGGQTAISADWAEALVNKEMIFTVAAPGATEVVMYEGGNKEYYATVLLTDGGASVRWTPEKTGTFCIRFEAKVDGQWLTTKNYALEVTSAGRMPRVRNLKPSASTVEPGTAVTITWDDPEGLTAPVYGVNVIRPGYDVDDYSYWYPVNLGETSYTFSSYNFETEGTYTLAVQVEADPGYEASVTTCTVEVKSTRLWDFNPDDNQLLAYHGTDKEIVIPAEIDGVPVWYISGSMFKDSDITSVVIPEGIRHIYRGVFQNCKSLTSVSLPSTLSYIGEYAFYGCKSLAQITLPEKLSTLGYYAFYNCDALTSVTIPAGITELYSETFYSCDALTQVTLPDGLTEIGSSAFAFCSSLKTITIPQSVTTIDRYAFEYVEDLTICGYLGSAAETFAEEQGYNFVALDSIQTGEISFTLERDTLYSGGLLKVTVTAPDAEKLRLHLDGEVYEYSVYNGNAEISRRIHEAGTYSVTMSQCVGGKWLAPCEALSIDVVDMEKPVIQPVASVPAGTPTTIYWKSVEGAVDFTLELSVDGNGVATYYDIVSMDKDGFVYQQLTAEELAHEGIYTVQITAHAADGGYAQSSRTFEVTKAEEFLYEVNEDGTATIIGHTGGGEEVAVPAELDGHAVVKIGQKAFLNSSAVSVTLPASVEVVDQWAFYDCQALETVKILEGQATIRMAAFKDCNKLVNIYIGAGIFLEDDALDGCRTDAVVYGYSGGRVEEVAKQACDFTPLGELAEGPVITAEDIWQNEKLNYTVALENASRLYIQEIYPDGRMDCFARGTGQTEEVADFYDFEDLEEDCVVRIKASALIDGAWTAYQEKEVTVSVLGILKEPVFKEIGRLERHLDHEIRWYSVENAETYHVEIRKDRTTEKAMDLDASQTKIILKAGELSAGDYTIKVTAMAEGFVEASASAEFEVYSIKLNAPEIMVDSRVAKHLGTTITWEAGSLVQNYSVVIQAEGENGPFTLYRNTQQGETEVSLTPGQLKTGNCTVSVTANAPYCTSSDPATAEFEVYEEPLDAPEVTAAETVVGGVGFDVTWKSVGDAELYHVEIMDEDGYRLFNRTVDRRTQSYHICLDEYLPERSLTLRVIASANYRVDGVAELPMTYKPLYTYEVVNGSAVITGYNGPDTDLWVPQRINGHTVTAIGDGAFENMDMLEEVYLPESVTSIGSRSFKNCSALQYIYGCGVTAIGEEAFCNCINLRNIRFSPDAIAAPTAFENTPVFTGEAEIDGLMDITVEQPQDGSDIESRENSLIRKVIYQEGVVTIPRRTHYGNILLRTVYLPRSLRNIESEAFANCHLLNTVYLYDGVEYIAEDAFEHSPDVGLYIYTSDINKVSYAEQYAIEHGIKYIKVMDPGIHTEEEGARIYRCPEGTIHIPERELYGDAYLETVFLPESLETIGSEAFAQCAYLRTVYLYDGITFIADDAFDGSETVEFILYVEDIDAVCYVEEYAEEHDIPCTKYEKPAEIQTEIELGNNGSAVNDPVWVRVDEPARIYVSDIPADAEEVLVYLDGKQIAIASVGEIFHISFAHTFREFGEHQLTAEAFQNGEVIKTSWIQPVIVTGIRLTADRESAWTCEPVTFTVEAYPETAELKFYAEDKWFGSAPLTENRGTLTYAFTQAGDREITVRSDNGLTSKILTLPILCIGQLEKPVLEAEEIQFTADGLVCSWNTTENTDGYVLRVHQADGREVLQHTFEDDGSQRMSCTIPAEDLGGMGTYQLYLMNYGYKYNQNESETITVELTDDMTPRFTMDKHSVMIGDPVNFTFCAFGATEIELWADGEAIETIPLTGSRGNLTRAFTRSGDRKMQIRALRKDGWTELSDVQVLQVISKGALDAVQVTADAVQLLGNSIKASWDVVDNADGYNVYFRNADHETIYQQTVTDCYIGVPADIVQQIGDYYFLVVAYGDEYDQSEGSAGVTVLDHLPGPVIVTPAENEVCNNTAVKLTWQEVMGAESYVVSLARKTDRVDGNGQPVYEKVWTAPNETVNVGRELAYDLSGLAYGGEYRVAVGTVSTLEDGSQSIGWTERLFRVQLPKLEVTLTADTLMPSEGTQVTLTAVANHPMTQAVLTDETGAVVETVSSGSEEVNGTRIFTFAVTGTMQGRKTYTVTISGLNELGAVQPVSASLEIEWLDGNTAAITSVTVDRESAWVGMESIFTIEASANTARVHVYLVTDSGQEWIHTRRPDAHDEGNTVTILDPRRFDAAGEYHLRYVAVNAAGEEGGDYHVYFTVRRMPAPNVTNLANGDIVPRENYTVIWEPVELGNGEIADCGVTVYLLTEQGIPNETSDVWLPLPDCYNVLVGEECSYTLPAMTPGETYRIEIYPVPEGATETTAEISDCTAINFTYRTIPSFGLTGIEGTFAAQQPVTVRWDAPVWRLDPAMKPDRYIIRWYRGSENIYTHEIGGNTLEATLPGEYVLDGVHTVDVYAILDGQQQKADGDNGFEIKPAQVTIDKYGDGAAPLTALTGEPITISGTATGGITKVLAILIPAGGKPEDAYALKAADGAEVNYIVADVVDGAYSMVLDPVKDLKVSDGDKTNHAIEVYGFYNEDLIETVEFADSTWAMVDVDGVEIYSMTINKESGDYWLFGDQGMNTVVTTSKAVSKIILETNGSPINVKISSEDGEGNIRTFTSKYFTIFKEGLHVITAKASNDASVSRSTNVYVVTRTDDKQLYCPEGQTVEIRSLPGETIGYVMATVNISSNIVQKGKYGEYLLVEVDKNRTGFVHKDKLGEQTSELKLIYPTESDTIILSEVDSFDIRWTPQTGAKSYDVKLTTHYVNRQGKESSVEIFTKTVKATGDPEQTLSVDTSEIINKVKPRSSIINTDWVTEIEITPNS